MNEKTKERPVWRWRLTRALESVGRTGWIGVGALLLAVVIALTVLRGMSQRTQALEKEIRELRTGKGDAGSRGGVALAQLLPDSTASADFAALLYQSAARDTVRIDRIDFQMLRETGKPLLAYRAEVVAVAPYLNLRKWLDGLLRDRPTVAIDELVFERPNADVGEVTARVRLTLFMKGEA